ncbi:MAG: Mov34/MPN/PAD-1 family protein [Thermoanaerobaculia bacterium]
MALLLQWRFARHVAAVRPRRNQGGSQPGMNRLVISPRHLHAIGRHAAMTYPGECSGVLIGRPHRNGLQKIFVERILSVQAFAAGDGPIPPETQAAAEQEARAMGLEVVGYYLARGGRTATPTELEFESLRPGMSYLLTAIESGQVVDTRVWRLTPDRQAFEEEAVEAAFVAPLPRPETLLENPKARSSARSGGQPCG